MLENNLVYRTTHGGFHQHYGRDNLVRNNIFAFGRDAQIVRSRDEPHRSFTFERNIVYYRTGELFSSVWSGGPDRITLDHNLYWNPRATPRFPGDSLEAWRARGFDKHSIVADPRFVDPDHDDFRLKPDSPAPKLGFRPLDLSAVGPRTPRGASREVIALGRGRFPDPVTFWKDRMTSHLVNRWFVSPRRIASEAPDGS